MIELWREHRFDAGRIRAVRTWVDKQRIAHTNRPRVRAGLEGKFSTQYCQAVAALTGGLGLGDFDDEAVVHPDRQGMMRRVELQVAPDAATWPGAEDPTGSQAARVEVELEDGAVYRTFTPIPRGYPGLQPSDADLEVKFLNCAGRGLGPAAARSLADQLLRLEACGDVAPIAEQVWTGEVA